MKKLLLIAPLLLFVLSCNKIETYPKKIIGGWIINKYIVNSENKTEEYKDTYKNLVLSFFEDKTYSQSFIDTNQNFIGNTGIYNFDEKSDSLFLYSNWDTLSYEISGINSNALNLKKSTTVANQTTQVVFQFVRK